MSVDHLPEVRRMMSEGHGDRKIGEGLGITRHQARNLMREVERADLKQGASAEADDFNETLRHDPEAWALRISKRWQASIDAIIQTGRLLLEAKEALPHGAFGKMIESDLPFGARTAQMLMAIATDKRLSNPKHVSHLPASWGTLHELTKLSDEEFDRGVQEQIIRPDMERKEVEILRPTPQRAKPEADQRDPGTLEMFGSDGRADEAMAREPVDPVGGEEPRPRPYDSLPQYDEQAGMGSERPGPSEAGAPASHMAGRVHPTGDLDYSPTPPWATRALVERVLRHAGREGQLKSQSAWEPACGEGHMAEVLREYFRDVMATDIHARSGYPDAINDFLANDGRGPGTYDWIITNPPFEERVIEFMDRALDLAGVGVAMFLQLRYLEGVGRYERIYRDRPPTIIAPFVERVPLLMGKYDPEASTTTAFMWLVWIKGSAPQAPFWIPNGCRKALTLPDDAERFTQKPVAKRSLEAAEAAE